MTQYKNLRTLRKALGFYPSAVAKQLNISYRQFVRIELGEGYLTENRAKKLSEIYQVNINIIKNIYKGSEISNDKRAEGKTIITRHNGNSRKKLEFVKNK